jgi:hypothetical protein
MAGYSKDKGTLIHQESQGSNLSTVFKKARAKKRPQIGLLMVISVKISKESLPETFD